MKLILGMHVVQCDFRHHLLYQIRINVKASNG